MLSKDCSPLAFAPHALSEKDRALGVSLPRNRPWVLNRTLEAAARRAYTRYVASLWEKIRNWLGIGKKKT